MLRPALPAMAGQRIVVLGAGIAGLVCTLELHRAGAEVTVLEAAPRIGGRSLTLRGGDAVTELDGATQSVGFDQAPGLYFNAGPARIPHHHQGLLGYCRELGVPLEVLVNENRAALVNGVPLAQARAGLRGLVAELATKALGAGLLDAPVSAEEMERLRAMLRNFGALTRDGRFRGTTRAGWLEPPGVAPGIARPPLPLAVLADPGLWQAVDFAEGVNYSATMLAPQGGMDRIVTALAAALPQGCIRLGTPVLDVLPAEGRVRLAQGELLQVDRIICTLPAPLAATLPGLPAWRRASLAAMVQEPAAKLAVQAPRFWEGQGIYGGISWLPDADITQLWYPSAGFHSPQGILTVAYIWDSEKALRFAGRSPAARAAHGLAEAAALHSELPGLAQHAVSVSWGRMAWARGAWAEPLALPAALLAPEGRVHFAGDWLSRLPGWQEGAVASAWHALGQLR